MIENQYYNLSEMPWILIPVANYQI